MSVLDKAESFIIDCIAEPGWRERRRASLRVHDWQTFEPGARIADVIEGFEVTLRPVTEPRTFTEHVGYARWFYKGGLFQLVWPDMQARFPQEPGTTEAFNQQQPLLP